MMAESRESCSEIKGHEGTTKEQNAKTGPTKGGTHKYMLIDRSK